MVNLGNGGIKDFMLYGAMGIYAFENLNSFFHQTNKIILN